MGKERLYWGIGLVIAGILIIANVTVPNTAVTSTLFPLSILGLFFGIGLLIWYGISKVSK